MTFISVRRIFADTVTGVRDYGLGRHLWALKPEQIAAFQKADHPYHLLKYHARCSSNLFRHSYGTQLAHSNAQPSC